MDPRVPHHHFPDELLLDYAAGNAREALGLPVACHLDLCRDCRRQVANLEAAVAAVLTPPPGPAGRDPVRDRLLAALPARDPAAGGPAPPRLSADLVGFELPAALHRYLDGEAGTAWRPAGPGVREIRLPLAQPGAAARLLKLRPGVVIPLHDHQGPEYTIIFQGGIEDDGVSFHRGDACIRGQGLAHVPRVLEGNVCVALVVNHGELVPLG